MGGKLPQLTGPLFLNAPDNDKKADGKSRKEYKRDNLDKPLLGNGGKSYWWQNGLFCSKKQEQSIYYCISRTQITSYSLLLFAPFLIEKIPGKTSWHSL
ncbi:hypothetical protein A2973_03820 [Candidatus Gottesmanbacteria bacterium RIFCSPLOWO2_01_FULL_49_10]|uniref:Uncharacterized protein n=1 Tax=Candidatus Gottesmanbacteria bacterium RIFCSPLOWO2_01_FULL_49_10 TaxID=1798396 RepID=A0A1F6B0X1_9BACT|nr:MAG: hypothetical protein A2973_03820 [Candidatus Gottesmanbacteria bacterium RIFCSPLOWO2_01_FULL_49_10]